jgi:hypothetical protein
MWGVHLSQQQRMGLVGIIRGNLVHAGDIIINANASVDLSGSGSGIFNQVIQGASGNGGDILINTQLLSATAEAFVFASTQSNTSGNSGQVVVNSDYVTLSSGAVIGSAVLGSGDAGDVGIIASQTVELTEADIIAIAGNSAIGNAGRIEVKTGNLTLAQNSEISSANFGILGNAGTIEINVNENATFLVLFLSIVLFLLDFYPARLVQKHWEQEPPEQ